MTTLTFPNLPIKYSKSISHTRSKLEQRIFMFVDMKSSTSIAEQIGTQSYFKLLQDYFEILIDPIADCEGEIYQIVGDEIIVSWLCDHNLYSSNPIKCYDAMKRGLTSANKKFLQKYGVVPEFKASIHCGEVIVSNWIFNSEQRVFIGDVLNTASRILCYGKQNNRGLLISADYYSQLPTQQQNIEYMERIFFRGKKQPIEIYSYDSGKVTFTLRQVC